MTEFSILSDDYAEWEQILTFDILVHNIPRMARLCLVIYENLKSSKAIGNRRRVKDSNKDYYVNPLGWVNTTVFDYKNQLKTGAMTLYTWPYIEESDTLFNSLGTVESNPRSDDRAALLLSIYK